MAGDPFTSQIFAWLNRVLADRSLPPAAFKLAYAISQHINRRSRTAWPSQETLAAAIGVPEGEHAARTVRRLLKALVDGGHLLTTRRKQSSLVYRLAQDRTELSYQGEQTEADIGSGPDISDRSTGQDRTFKAARPDNPVLQDRTEMSAKPLNEPLKNQEREKRARVIPIPDDWKLSDEDHDFALAEGFLNPDEMAGAFVDHYRSNGQQRVDWSAAWRGWVRKERQFARIRADSAADRHIERIRSAPDPSTLTDEAWDQILALFAKTGVWTRHIGLCGNAPPAPDCLAPKHLLAKHGLIGKDAA